MWDEYQIFPLLGTYCYYADEFLDLGELEQEPCVLRFIGVDESTGYAVYSDIPFTVGWGSLFPLGIIFVEPI